VACDPKSGRIDFYRTFALGTRFSCLHCGAEHQPVHGTLERDWRHLNSFPFQAYIHAKVLRVRCGTCRQDYPGCGALGAPTAASAYGWRPYWSPSVRRWRSFRALNYLASATGASGAPSIIPSIRRTLKRTSRPSPRLVSTRPSRGVDTIRRSHDYMSLFHDLDAPRGLYACEGRKAPVVAQFADAFEAPGACAENIGAVCMDMSASYRAGVCEHRP